MSRRTPSPLAELRRRQAQSALQAAAEEGVRTDVLAWTLRGAVPQAKARMAEEVAERAGDRYQRWGERQGYRNGTAPGCIVVGGRKVKIDRPRLVDADKHELPLRTYAWMQNPETMDQTALHKVLAHVAQRAVNEDLKLGQPLPEQEEDGAVYGATRSSVSRRWIEATADALAAQAARPLRGRRYLAILLDAKGFGEQVLIAGMGIDEQGHKHILGVWPGDGENQEVCKAALEDMQRRGLDVTKGVLVIIDGGKGLASAVRQLWGDVAILGRCRQHKKRNVLMHLPKSEHRRIGRLLENIWHQADADCAHQDLLDLIAELEDHYPEAAASLREGLAETLTCQRLGLPPELIRALGTTNLIENAFSSTESICRRVCRWRNGAQAVRWATMSLLKAERGFHPAASPEAMQTLARVVAAELASRAERDAAD